MSDPTIPERLRAVCEFSPKDKPHYVNIEADGTFQFTEGWMKNRSAGGGNALADAKRFPRYACPGCMERHLKGYDKQPGLF
jgi:hypothetical protein